MAAAMAAAATAAAMAAVAMVEATAVVARVAAKAAAAMEKETLVVEVTALGFQDWVVEAETAQEIAAMAVAEIDLPVHRPSVSA